MRNLLSGLTALALVLFAMPFAASAENDTIAYKPGALKSAVEAGKTVLLHYKSTW